MGDLETAAILSQKIYENLDRADPNVPVRFGFNNRYEVLKTSNVFNPNSSCGIFQNPNVIIPITTNALKYPPSQAQVPRARRFP